MAITTVDQLANKMSSSAQHLWGYDEMSVTAFKYASLWNAAGQPGGASGAPSNEAPTSSSTGALPFTNPAVGNTLYLAAMGNKTNFAGMMLLYDRLSHMSGLDATVTTSQTVNTTALTRYTDGVGVQMWAEVYTATGVTAKTLTATYTNSAGTGSRTGAVTFPGSLAAGMIVKIPLQAGDVGVQSVQSIILSGSTGTAGNFGITLVKPLRHMANDTDQDYLSTNLVEIKSNACLVWLMQANATSTAARLRYYIKLVEG